MGKTPPANVGERVGRGAVAGMLLSFALILASLELGLLQQIVQPARPPRPKPSPSARPSPTPGPVPRAAETPAAFQPPPPLEATGSPYWLSLLRNAPRLPDYDRPISRLPGPPRDEALEFRLNQFRDLPLLGREDPENERWLDVADNPYAPEFVRNFSYADQGPGGPRVLVRLEDNRETLTGRLEAVGLKPNFAYQLKLLGNYRRDLTGFEIIGGLGRWRLPGTGTNYLDEDYDEAPEEVQAETEAYILFDFFVTDARGRAVRNFALDTSLHVLWTKSEWNPLADDTLLAVTVDRSDARIYREPSAATDRVWIWGELEDSRHRETGWRPRLPPRRYRAWLVLTEESFHSFEDDGGYWATVMRAPVEFTISDGAGAAGAAPPAPPP